MGNKFEIYSNDEFAKNLQTLIINKGYNLDEILEMIKRGWNIEFSKKQLQKYVRGTTNQRIGSDILYVLAEYFNVSIDSLLGRYELGCLFTEPTDDPNFNKFHLNSNSRQILSEIDNNIKIDVLNNIISKSNLLDVFAIQIENATAQLKDITDKKTKDNIIFECSCSVQREIYNLFKKSVNDYMKKK